MKLSFYGIDHQVLAAEESQQVSKNAERNYLVSLLLLPNEGRHNFKLQFLIIISKN